MIIVGVTTNKFTFGNLLKLAWSKGYLKSMLEVFNEMYAPRVALGTNTYNFLIEACALAVHHNVFFLNFMVIEI